MRLKGLSSSTERIRPQSRIVDIYYSHSMPAQISIQPELQVTPAETQFEHATSKPAPVYGNENLSVNPPFRPDYPQQSSECSIQNERSHRKRPCGGIGEATQMIISPKIISPHSITVTSSTFCSNSQPDGFFSNWCYTIARKDQHTGRPLSPLVGYVVLV